MGGTVAVTLRTEDGVEHRMARWTNIFPQTVHHLDFISGSLDYWRDSLKRFYDMKKDWDDNHEEYQKRRAERPDDYGYQSEVFQFPMTPCYGDYTLLAPEGYGLIVLDQVEKKILEMQGYTSFGHQNIARIGLGMHWDALKDIKAGKLALSDYIDHLRKKDEDNAAVEFYDLCEAGKVVGREEYDRSIDDFRMIDLRGSSTEEIFEIVVDTSVNRRSAFGHYKLDLSPYTVERFDEDSEGAIAMRQRILELGFGLSDEEERLWQEWINDELEQEKEDDGF